MIIASTSPLSSSSSGFVNPFTLYFSAASFTTSGTISQTAVNSVSSILLKLPQWADPMPPVPITPNRTFCIIALLAFITTKHEGHEGREAKQRRQRGAFFALLCVLRDLWLYYLLI